MFLQLRFLAFIPVSKLVGVSMMDVLSRCVLEPRSANDYRVLTATLVPLFFVSLSSRRVSPAATSPFAGLINLETKTDSEEVRSTAIASLCC